MGLRSLFIISLLAAATGAQAQTAAPGDTTLKGASTIEIIQSYKPKVKQSPKPEWMPQLPPADTAHAALTYDVPQQTLYYTYNSLPLRPLALNANPGQPIFPNYVKAGGGNLSTLYLDAGIGGIYGKDYETGIHLHHISQKGNIEYQQSALSGLKAEGTLHKAKNDISGMVMVERNQYYNYGYDHGLYDYPRDSVRQTYTTVRLGADLKNKPDSNSAFSYHPAINASMYHARYNTSELTLGFNAPVSYAVDSTLDLKLALTGALTTLHTDSVSQGNSYIELLPGVAWHHEHLSGHALAGLAMGKSGGYILPDVVGEYKVTDGAATVSLGWLATLRQNTYEQLTTENPYLTNVYPVLQTRSDEVFAQLQGRVGNHISYTGRVSWWSFNDLPTFVNDFGDMKQFYIDYEHVKALSLRAAARYSLAAIWSVGVTGDFYRFYNISDQYVWHEPSMKIKTDLMVAPISKLTITAYMELLGGIHARDQNLQPVSLKPILDLGGNAEYQIIPRLSAFVQASNLLNNKYQRWWGYQAYGLNIYGGLRLKF